MTRLVHTVLALLGQTLLFIDMIDMVYGAAYQYSLWKWFMQIENYCLEAYV